MFIHGYHAGTSGGHVMVVTHAVVRAVSAASTVAIFSKPSKMKATLSEEEKDGKYFKENATAKEQERSSEAKAEDSTKQMNSTKNVPPLSPFEYKNENNKNSNATKTTAKIAPM